MGRFITLKVSIADRPYVLLSVYDPSEDKEVTKFFHDLLATINRGDLDAEQYFIIGGDFNSPFNLGLDKKGGSLNALKKVIKSLDSRRYFDLVDVWQVQNPITKSCIESRIT